MVKPASFAKNSLLSLLFSEKAPEVEALIDELGLMFMGAAKVDEVISETPD